MFDSININNEPNSALIRFQYFSIKLWCVVHFNPIQQTPLGICKPLA